MEIEGIIIDGIVYVPMDRSDCRECAFDRKCARLTCKGQCTYKFPCDLVDKRALKVKED